MHNCIILLIESLNIYQLFGLREYLELILSFATCFIFSDSRSHLQSLSSMRKGKKATNNTMKPTNLINIVGKHCLSQYMIIIEFNKAKKHGIIIVIPEG